MGFGLSRTWKRGLSAAIGLLLLVIVPAAYYGWQLVNKMQAIYELQRVGGGVGFDGEKPGWLQQKLEPYLPVELRPVKTVTFHPEVVGGERQPRFSDLELLQRFPHVERLEFWQKDASTDWLQHVPNPGRIRMLRINPFTRKPVATPSGSPGLESLHRFTNLENLALANLRLAPGELGKLQLAPRLRTLALAGGRGHGVELDEALGDNDIRAFANCRGLEHLQLISLPVTDDDLKSLSTLKNLKTLDVWDTEATEKGIEDLRQQMPQCKVHWLPRRQAGEQ